MRNSSAKKFRQYEYVDELPSMPLSRNIQRNSQTVAKRSNLKLDEEEQLVAAFREYVRLEMEIDMAKSRLASQDDFNLMDAYQMIDKNSKGWVTAPELLEALFELGSSPHKDDVFLFVRRYDRDGDGRILYSDFCDAFTPADEGLANALQRRPAEHIQQGYCRTHFFTMETRNMFLSTFRSHFTIEESAELIRKRLSRRPNFNIHEAFLALDRDSNGYISRSELRIILSDHGVFANE